MKKKTFLFFASLMTAIGISAQTLPDGMIMLLPDGVTANINSARKSAAAKNLMVAGDASTGYKAFFAGNDGTNGEELWVTDGTVAGTQMVKDINPGSSGSDVNWITRFNDKVVFAANDGTNGMELWISDGTAAGTVMIKDIYSGADSASPTGFTQLNETQFIFIAKSADSGGLSWLWVSDGTTAGTEKIYECDARFPGVVSTSWTSHTCRVGRNVFFKAHTATAGEELWVTDGTTAGTKMVKDILAGTGNGAIDNMINFYNEKLFLKAFGSAANQNEAWASDGTEEGTYEIIGFSGATGNASEAGTYPYNGKIYYRASTAETGAELACTNLEPGNFKIFDINTTDPTASNASSPGTGAEFDGVYFFSANGGSVGGELYYTDGETVTLRDLNSGSGSSWPRDFTVVAGTLFFNTAGTASAGFTKLHKIESKDDAAIQVVNLTGTTATDNLNTLRNLDGTLLFAESNNSKLYAYTYRKADYDPEVDVDNMDRDLEFRTRAEIEYDLALGIENINTQTGIILYPNPTSDRFYINLTEELTSVMIFDLVGRLVYQAAALTDNSVDVSSLTSGVYNVSITSKIGRYTSSLIIK